MNGHTYTHTNTHSHIHRYIHIYKYTSMGIYTNTCTHMQQEYTQTHEHT